MLALTGCAANTSLGVPSATGTVRIYQAGQLMDWPAQHVFWNHPSSGFKGPFSKQLWDLGHRIPVFHCYYLREDGSPTRITLMGLVKATADKNTRGLFGGRFSQQDANVSLHDGGRIESVLTESILRDAQGDPARVQQLVNQSLAHDLNCLRQELDQMRTMAELYRENKALVMDEAGRQIVIGVEPERGYYRKLLYWLGEHENGVRELSRTYELLANQLTSRLARASPRVAALPRETSPPHRPAPTPAPTKAALPPPQPVRITVDTAPLRAHERETAEAIKALKANCLLYAKIDCT